MPQPAEPELISPSGSAGRGSDGLILVLGREGQDIHQGSGKAPVDRSVRTHLDSPIAVNLVMDLLEGL